MCHHRIDATLLEQSAHRCRVIGAPAAGWRHAQCDSSCAHQGPVKCTCRGEYHDRSRGVFGALAPLGYTLIMEATAQETGQPAAGFGSGGKPDFWIGGEGKLEKPVHIAITAKDRPGVDRWPAVLVLWHDQLLRLEGTRERSRLRRSRLPDQRKSRNWHPEILSKHAALQPTRSFALSRASKSASYNFH